MKPVITIGKSLKIKQKIENNAKMDSRRNMSLAIEDQKEWIKIAKKKYDSVKNDLLELIPIENKYEIIEDLAIYGGTTS